MFSRSVLRVVGEDGGFVVLFDIDTVQLVSDGVYSCWGPAMHANSPEYLSGDGTSAKLVGNCKLQGAGLALLLQRGRWEIYVTGRGYRGVVVRVVEL